MEFWDLLNQSLMLILLSTMCGTFQVLISSFDKCDIDQAIIMFGATPFTTKEAFFVHLPTVTRNHFAANHPDAAETICRKVIR